MKWGYVNMLCVCVCVCVCGTIVMCRYCAVLQSDYTALCAELSDLIATAALSDPILLHSIS